MHGVLGNTTRHRGRAAGRAEAHDVSRTVAGKRHLRKLRRRRGPLGGRVAAFNLLNDRVPRPVGPPPARRREPRF